MLYKLGKKQDRFDSIEPVAFKGLPLEKDLEDLLAKSLWDVLLEGNELMPILQERSWQPEADMTSIPTPTIQRVLFSIPTSVGILILFGICAKGVELRHLAASRESCIPLARGILFFFTTKAKASLRQVK